MFSPMVQVRYAKRPARLSIRYVCPEPVLANLRFSETREPFVLILRSFDRDLLDGWAKGHHQDVEQPQRRASRGAGGGLARWYVGVE